MTISTDLDDWADDLALVTGITVTRDPDKVIPPCIYVGMPDGIQATIGEQIALDVPVTLVAPAPSGKASGDWLLDNILTFLDALDRPGQATVQTLPGTDFPSYQTFVRLHFTPEPPPPAPAPPALEEIEE
jgi:hypothetical protein